MNVSEISTSSTLCCTIPNFDHKHHIFLIILDGFFKQCFYFFRKFSWILMSKAPDMFSLNSIEMILSNNLGTKYNLIICFSNSINMCYSPLHDKRFLSCKVLGPPPHDHDVLGIFLSDDGSR